MPKSIPGIEGNNVLSAADVLSGKLELKNKNIAVVGSGMTGIETAHYLSERGNNVSVYEMADEIGPGLFFQNLIDIMSHIGPLGVKLYPKHKLIGIEENKAVFENTETAAKEEHSFDYIIISLGTVSNKELIDEIEASFDRVQVLGDAKKAGKIRNAMETAFVGAYSL
jgi:Uncharacterized NAD(FAD)-dependent dehydrogenases